MSVEYRCCTANIVVRRSNSLRKKFVVRPATQRRNRRHQALRSSPSPSSSPRRSSCRRRFGCSWRALGGSTPRARWGARVLLPAARDVLASPAAARRCVNRHAVTCAPSSVASALRPRCAPSAIFCDRCFCREVSVLCVGCARRGRRNHEEEAVQNGTDFSSTNSLINLVLRPLPAKNGLASLYA